jgi:hypothetical protein
MTRRIEIGGGADDLTAAAITAAVARLEEERAAAAATPPARPAQTMWVLSTRPRPVQPDVSVRRHPTLAGWSVASEESEED